ncbi:HD domain-containing protein [Schleiferilactobacillus harbinensis]|uniref:HD domain-containing protein n=1 Tax=Schleiferilactobacillus harbinensis TaxID=304207 RepID=UPI0039E7AF39
MDHLPAIIDLARQQAAGDQSGHDFAHIQRVAANARQLLTAYPDADQDLVLSTAYLHDYYDEKLVANTTAAKVALVQTLRTAVGLTQERIDQITFIIDHMSFSKNIETHQHLPLAGQIVQDADRLDALGAVGIFRAIRYGATHGNPDYDPHIPPRQELTAANYRQPSTIVNHFYEKLFKLAATMNTPIGRQMATERTAFMKQFIKEYFQEIGK